MAKNSTSKPKLEEALKDIWTVLNDEQRAYLSENAEFKTFKRNEVIHHEGDVPDRMKCLVSGKIKIHKEGPGERSQIIRLTKPIEYFGYRAYFSGEVYTNSATAVETSTVCIIPMTVIDKLLKQNCSLAYFFIKELSNHLGISDRRTVNLTQKHIRGRLAESLLFLKDNYGLESDGFTLSIYLSREDLANLSNMTTSNAIRILSQFATERLIAIDGRKIKLLEEDKLRKISKMG